jgi:hypothetical protein
MPRRAATLPIHERDRDFLSFAVMACLAASRESRSRTQGLTAAAAKSRAVGVLHPCGQHNDQQVQVAVKPAVLRSAQQSAGSGSLPFS